MPSLRQQQWSGGQQKNLRLVLAESGGIRWSFAGAEDMVVCSFAERERGSNARRRIASSHHSRCPTFPSSPPWLHLHATAQRLDFSSTLIPLPVCRRRSNRHMRYWVLAFEQRALYRCDVARQIQLSRENAALIMQGQVSLQTTVGADHVSPKNQQLRVVLARLQEAFRLCSATLSPANLGTLSTNGHVAWNRSASLDHRRASITL